MAWRSVDDAVGASSGFFQEAGHGLIRMAGGWGNFAGPSVFMIRTLVAGTTSAITIGLAGSGIAAAIFGTASLPFLIFSCVGFAFGAVSWYRNALERSLIALERNPNLIRLHLDANYPDRGFRRMPANHLKSAFSQGWVFQSMLVAAWLTAQPALDSILETQEQAAIMNPADDSEPAQIETEK